MRTPSTFLPVYICPAPGITSPRPSAAVGESDPPRRAVDARDHRGAIFGFRPEPQVPLEIGDGQLAASTRGVGQRTVVVRVGPVGLERDRTAERDLRLRITSRLVRRHPRAERRHDLFGDGRLRVARERGEPVAHLRRLRRCRRERDETAVVLHRRRRRWRRAPPARVRAGTRDRDSSDPDRSPGAADRVPPCGRRGSRIAARAAPAPVPASADRACRHEPPRPACRSDAPRRRAVRASAEVVPARGDSATGASLRRSALRASAASVAHRGIASRTRNVRAERIMASR